MDNFSIDITAEGRQTLLETLRLVFRHNAPGGKAKYWTEIDTKAEGEWPGAGKNRKALVLLWHEEQRQGVDLQRFPVPLDADGACKMVWRWLQETPYGSEPDHDGDNGKGFRVYCDCWGHFDRFFYSIVGVTPAWAMYGK